jgi:uncharacterized protein YlxP (DUF503 family)
MHVAVVRFELHIPAARSLKEKRAVLRPIVEGIRNRFSVSVAEIEYQDKWQRAAVGVGLVAESHRQAEHVVNALERWVWSRPDAEVASFETRWSSWKDDADDEWR